MEAVDVLTRAREEQVRLIRFLYCDNGGLIRGKATHVSGLAGRLASGIGLTVAMQAFTAQDELAHVEGMGPVGEIRLVPDPTTFVLLPYAPSTAAMLVDMQRLDGRPWEACPRSFLRRQLELLEIAGYGRVRAAFEAEFTLARRDASGRLVPLDDSPCFSTTGMNAAAGVVDAILSALEAQGLTPEQYYPELAHGQHEISLRHVEGVSAADVQVLLRETLRAVAAHHGLVASFAPKPWLDQAGNGAHLHFSLWSPDGRRNLLSDLAAPYGLSRIGRQFAAGVLTHLPAIVAISCASVNSYRRLQPNTWSSAFTAWGPDNREAALRLASPYRGAEAASINLELKACDATGNPYLVLGAVVAAGRDGISRGLDLPEPMLDNPSTLSLGLLQERGIRRLPASLDQALSELIADEYLRGELPKQLFVSYLAVKRLEILHFAERDVDYELARHFAAY